MLSRQLAAARAAAPNLSFVKSGMRKLHVQHVMNHHIQAVQDLYCILSTILEQSADSRQVVWDLSLDTTTLS